MRFFGSRRSKKVRRPENEADRERILKMLAAEYTAGRLTRTAYKIAEEQVEKKYTQAQLRTALECVNTTGNIVAALGVAFAIGTAANKASASSGEQSAPEQSATEQSAPGQSAPEQSSDPQGSQEQNDANNQVVQKEPELFKEPEPGDYDDDDYCDDFGGDDGYDYDYDY